MGCEMLERSAMKVARSVLRGLGVGNGLRLLDRSNDGIEGRGDGKKRRATCNELYRGSRFALTRKGADLLAVFHCMNGGKLMNVRYSTTLKSERLADAQCVNRLQTRITKAVIEM